MYEQINKHKLIETYTKFKRSKSYNDRKSQTKFVEVAQNIIRIFLSLDKITNKHLTSLIQLFAWNCSDNNFTKYLKVLGLSAAEVDKIFKRFKAIGEHGYTGRAKSAISGLKRRQLDAVKQFLNAIWNSTNKDDVKKSVRVFESKNVPQVKNGIYSPWLYYIKPGICPLVTGEVRDFLFEDMEWDNDYCKAIDLFGAIKETVGEEDLGLTDSYLMNLEEGDDILGHNNAVTGKVFPSFVPLLADKKQIILYGPPGTGKTYFTKNIGVAIIEYNED